MKVLSRDFNLTEKVLLVILSVLLVALVYYRFVDTPVREATANSITERHELEDELIILNAKLSQLDKMQKEVDSITSKDTSYIYSYNNVRPEIDFLHEVLALSDAYRISFADVTRTGDLIRREVQLEFSAKDYDTACEILEMVEKCEMRCKISDVKVTGKRINDYPNLDMVGKTIEETSSNKVSLKEVSKEVSVTASIMFYETMVGGKADSGLPADSAKSK